MTDRSHHSRVRQSVIEVLCVAIRGYLHSPPFQRAVRRAAARFPKKDNVTTSANTEGAWMDRYWRTWGQGALVRALRVRRGRG